VWIIIVHDHVILKAFQVFKKINTWTNAMVALTMAPINLNAPTSII
jgi:hypothetical protein